jgi:hypothetical protein
VYWGFDFQFHQIEQIGASGQEFRPWRSGRGCRGFGGSAHPLVRECFHKPLLIDYWLRINEE